MFDEQNETKELVSGVEVVNNTLEPSSPIITAQILSGGFDKPKKSKVKIVLFVIIDLLVLVGIALAGFFYLKNTGSDSLTSIVGIKSAEDYYQTDEILNKLQLSDTAKKMLKDQSFVAVDWGREDDFVEAYDDLRSSEIPIFVTSDSVLHLYHIQFDETLKEIEEKEFYDDIWQISSTLNKRMQDIYQEVGTEELKQAANTNQAYFSIVLKLLEPKTNSANDQTDQSTKFTTEDFAKYVYTTPSYLTDKVDQELALIEAHQGYEASPNFDYKEDYSQYVARGHYTRSEKLKNYFKAFMYLGRMSFFLNGGEKGIVSEEVARKQTIQATMIATELQNNPDLFEKWQRIYQITSFYVGVSDDLSPVDYTEAINKFFASKFNYNDLKEEQLKSLKNELNLKESPAITGGAGQCSVVVDPNAGIIKNQEKCTDQAKGMRFMGQRFIPDSYIMEHLTLTNEKIGEYLGKNPSFTTEYPAGDIGIKGFPRGLEVFAIFGSERAKEIIKQEGDDNYKNYEESFVELKSEVDQFTTEQWQQNAYWSWIYSLKSLTKKYDETYPKFMRSLAWQDKQANAFLASWAELRHDTILYAKQGYTDVVGMSSSVVIAPKPKPPVGYVEPVPEFYGRLIELTQKTKEMLNQYKVLDEVSEKRLDSLTEIVDRLQKISELELKNQELSEDDYRFIKYFGDEISSAVTSVDVTGLQTTLVADVHTYSDGLNNLALEEGVGYLKKLIVSYELPDGRTLVGAGPILSYYEFKQPMNNRLTDEAWRKMLLSKEVPQQPVWTQSFKVQ